jgi:hypothetical protein
MDLPGLALPREAGPGVLQGAITGFPALVAKGGLNAQTLLAFLQAINVPLVDPSVPRRRHHRLDLGRPVLSLLGHSDMRNRSPLGQWRENHDLIVVRASKRKVIQATGSDPTGTVKGAHVGSAMGRVVGNHRFHPIVAKHEVAQNAIRFLATNQEVGVLRPDFKRLRCRGWSERE